MASFDEFLNTFSSDSNERGKQFEYFIKFFLKNDPKWSTQVEQIWLWNEYPERWGKDCGIDLIFKHKNGEIWAVQAKCYATDYPITKKDIDKFLSESNRNSIQKRLIIATTDFIGTNAKQVCDAQEKPVCRFMLSNFIDSSIDYPSHIKAFYEIKRKITPLPFPHQVDAIKDVCEEFQKSNRGKLIMACGTGKSFTTFWIKEALNAHNTLVLVPSLGLLSQILKDWTYVTKHDFSALCVCSDETVGKHKYDNSVHRVVDLGFPVTLNVEKIRLFLKEPGNKVVFSTYQSSPLIADAHMDPTVPAFDITIADEAHRCAGKATSSFSTILHQYKIRANKRLFTTATPRIYSNNVINSLKERGIEIIGMDDETKFGKIFHSLPFSKAIEKGLLTDYQVAIICVNEPMIAEWIEKRELLGIDFDTIFDSETLACHIALLKAIKYYDLKKIISFHRTRERAKNFSQEIQNVWKWVKKEQRPNGYLWSDYITGEMPTGKRRQKLDKLKSLDKDSRGILSNAQCLSEGIDVPSLDGVAFIDPRGSEVDIVQIVGRAIRLSESKKVGTIFLPVFIRSGENAEEVIEKSNFKPVWEVVAALRAHDDALEFEIDRMRTELGRKPNSRIGKNDFTKIFIDLPQTVDPSFGDKISTYMVEKTTAPWNFWFGLLQTYIAKHGHTRVPGSQQIQGNNLGKWVSHQRNFYKQGVLPIHRQKQLESLKEWSWDATADYWNQMYCLLEKYTKEYGHSRVQNEYESEGYNLGAWVCQQRMYYTRKKLSSEHTSLLSKLSGWTWDARGTWWDDKYALLQEYIKIYNHSNVPDKFEFHEQKLGVWVSAQHQRYRDGTLSKTRKTLLEKLSGWQWRENKKIDLRKKPTHEKSPRKLSPYKTQSFPIESYLEALNKFVSIHRHSRVPSDFHVDGLKLGGWVQRQRNKFYNLNLNQELKQYLQQLPGWSWNPDEEAWNEHYQILIAFVNKEGHALVPQEFVAYDKRLGDWVISQRCLYKKGILPINRQKLLEQVTGWSWSPKKDTWEKYCKLVEQYSLQHGHALIPAKHKINNLKVGSWISIQRQLYHNGILSKDKRHSRGTLSLEKIQCLESISGWSWNPIDEEFEKNFKLLENFYEENSHVLISRKSKINRNLGEWINRVRQLKRKNKLSLEKMRRFEQLPFWSWDPDHDSWYEKYNLLKNYLENHKNSRITQKFRIDTHNIGSWITAQRQSNAENKLSPTRKKLLESLPYWTWNSRTKVWDSFFALLSEFARQYGHTFVPAKCEMNGKKLGIWVQSQRQRFKNRNLNAMRQKKLETVHGWTWFERITPKSNNLSSSPHN